MSDWQERLTGAKETHSMSAYRAQFTLTQTLNRFDERAVTLTCPNGRRIHCGSFTTPSLQELIQHLPPVPMRTYDKARYCKLKVSNIVTDDVGTMHREHPGALFQVASQFNTLEMTSENILPSFGVGIYERDRTQGPACAMAAGAGAVYRNYFTGDRQINCLADVALALGDQTRGGDAAAGLASPLWSYENGYVFTKSAMNEPSFVKLYHECATNREAAKMQLRVGVQADTALTVDDALRVTQVYCAALPVAYIRRRVAEAPRADFAVCEWFAQLVLEGAYEATLAAAVKYKCDKVFLTFVGGGVYGNEPQWIEDAIMGALYRFRAYPLDVQLVNFRALQDIGRNVVKRWNDLI